MIVFPDISFWQDNNSTKQGVDFVKMARQTQAVIIRAGQNRWIDEDFNLNYFAAKSARLMRGVYWFYDSRSAPKEQADLLQYAVKSDKPECGMWLDFEESYGGSYSSDKHMKEFAERVMARYPDVKVGVYTGYYWWVNRVTWRTRSWWKRLPLWIAAYPRTPDLDQYTPKVPAPFSSWLFHQYTDRGDGALYGVESSRIDLNRFNGSWDDFKRYFG